MPMEHGTPMHLPGATTCTAQVEPAGPAVCDMQRLAVTLQQTLRSEVQVLRWELLTELRKELRWQGCGSPDSDCKRMVPDSAERMRTRSMASFTSSPSTVCLGAAVEVDVLQGALDAAQLRIEDLERRLQEPVRHRPLGPDPTIRDCPFHLLGLCRFGSRCWYNHGHGGILGAHSGKDMVVPKASLLVPADAGGYCECVELDQAPQGGGLEGSVDEADAEAALQMLEATKVLILDQAMRSGPEASCPWISCFLDRRRGCACPPAEDDSAAFGGGACCLCGEPCAEVFCAGCRTDQCDDEYEAFGKGVCCLCGERSAGEFCAECRTAQCDHAGTVTVGYCPACADDKELFEGICARCGFDTWEDS